MSLSGKMPIRRGCSAFSIKALHVAHFLHGERAHGNGEELALGR
jgi:hypothetical protein